VNGGRDGEKGPSGVERNAAHVLRPGGGGKGNRSERKKERVRHRRKKGCPTLPSFNGRSYWGLQRGSKTGKGKGREVCDPGAGSKQLALYGREQPLTASRGQKKISTARGNRGGWATGLWGEGARLRAKSKCWVGGSKDLNIVNGGTNIHKGI